MRTRPHLLHHGRRQSCDDDSELTRTKRRRADEGKVFDRPHLAAGDRLPAPGQQLVKNRPVFELDQLPNIRPEGWRLDVTDGAGNPKSFG